MDIRSTPLAGFLAAVAADQPAPGAGAAAGVALGLAAACASKALRISGRRGEDDDLARAADRAQTLAERAIVSAQDDCEDFPAVLMAPNDADAARRLQAGGEAGLKAARELRTLIEAYADRVVPELTGDLAAALHLLGAAEQIITGNLAEL